MTELADLPIRERVRNDLDAPLFVEAGAGTGKTTELVARVLSLIDSGVELRNIAAITFTEAAAAELRDRVRGELEDRVHSEVERVRERAVLALEQMDAAALETLHAFSGRLLGMYPLEAGIPPRYQVIDDVGYAIEADREWDAVHARLQDDASLEVALTYALALKVKIEARRGPTLRSIFDSFGENWDRLPEESFIAEPFTEPDVTRLVESLEEALGRRHECDDPQDKLLDYLNRIEDAYRRLAHATVPVQRARALTGIWFSGRNLGRQEHWDNKRAVVDLVTAAREEHEALMARLGASVLPPLLEHLRTSALEFADRRRREGLLAFQDLLVLARNLLRNHPLVRTELHQRFTRLLIDEFQDTDPLQADIADLLARPNDKAPYQPGRLFFVGDAKQSIYRFRRADITMYQDSRTRFDCEAISLSSNFRSASAVIDWCNHVFVDLLGEEQPGQAGFQFLHASRKSLEGGSVHLLGEAVEGTAEEIREQEAQAIAEAIATIRHEHWKVHDRVTGDWREARFDDIAVLLRSRTILRQLERHFEDLELPYRVESRSLVFETQDIRDLTNILAAIDDPTDEVSVVAALRAPAFACGDDDLARHHAAGGRWDYVSDLHRNPDAAGPVHDAFIYLNGLHHVRAWMPLGELVDRVIRERGLREIAFAHRRPREHWQRYRFLLEQVRSLESNQGANLRDLVNWLRRQASANSLVNETVTPEEDDEAIRVMTVHASKGLEFPIVIMAGFGGRPSDWTSLVWPRHGGSPEVKLGEARTAGFDEASNEDQEMEAFERRRLVYVASTRARDHLIVSAFHKPGRGDQKTEAELIVEACATAPALWKPFAVNPVPAEPFEPSLADRASLPSFEDWQASRHGLLSRQRTLNAIAATAVATHGPELETPPGHEERVFRRGRAGTAIGRAVHAVLQSVDLEAGADAAVLARAASAAEGVPALAGDIERMVRAAIASAPVQEALASGRYWREVFVASPVDEVLVEGFIDLLYESPDGLVVVDYKTDSVAGEEDLSAALDRYRLQGAAYALALERTLGRPVRRCQFLFVRPNTVPVAEVPDLPSAMAEVERVVAARAAATLDPSKDEGVRA